MIEVRVSVFDSTTSLHAGDEVVLDMLTKLVLSSLIARTALPKACSGNHTATALVSRLFHPSYTVHGDVPNKLGMQS